MCEQPQNVAIQYQCSTLTGTQTSELSLVTLHATVLLHHDATMMLLCLEWKRVGVMDNDSDDDGIDKPRLRRVRKKE